jgi:magnesium transporter
MFPQLIGRERVQIFELVEGAERRAEILAEVEEDFVTEILDALDLDAVAELLTEMNSDDAADILSLLDDERTSQILARMQGEDALEVEDLMGYDPETAGGIMSAEFFSLGRDTSVKDAIAALQREDSEIEMAFYVYVVNEHGHLVGVVSLRQLVMSRPDRSLSDIMEPDVITVPVHADQEEVARIVARYNFIAVPVVDAGGKLLGIVTVDDIIDVLYDEAAEDLLKLAGAGQELGPQAGVRDHLKMRYPWLIATCFGGMMAAVILDPFMETLGTFLGLFVPVVIGMAGNVGIQSSTVVVRGLATGHVDPSQAADVIRREILVGFLLGIGYGLVVGGLAAVYGHLSGEGSSWAQILYFGFSVGLALAMAILLAATLGTAIPVGLSRFGVDPAVATGPFVTTALDVLGLLAYFGIAVGLAHLFGQA